MNILRNSIGDNIHICIFIKFKSLKTIQYIDCGIVVLVWAVRDKTMSYILVASMKHGVFVQ